MSAPVDEKAVENAHHELERLRRLAWSLPLPEVAALAERVRVEVMIGKNLQRTARKFYGAYSDYLDDVVEERADKENRPRDSFQHHVLDYIRGMLDPNSD